MMRRLVVAALIAGAVLVVPVGSAQAIAACKAGYQCTTLFYADAAHTVLNGASGYDCQGNPWHYGTLRGYAVVEQAPGN